MSTLMTTAAASVSRIASLGSHWFQPATARSLATRTCSTVSHVTDKNPSNTPLDNFGMTKATDAPQIAFEWHRMLSAKGLTRADIEHALSYATTIGKASRAGGIWRRDGQPVQLDVLRGAILANMFFEPSTRTSSSFATAMARMGGTHLNLNIETSSAKKGETMSDTLNVMSKYADVIVMRHPNSAVFGELAQVDPNVPILNAGNGADEHPTQALLDLLCMKSELGSLDGLTITMVGDLKFGRTVHSLSCLLSRFDNVKLNLVSPPSLRMPTEWIDQMNRNDAQKDAPNLKVRELESYHDVVSETDVLYMTRIQKERFESEAAYDAVKESFVLTPDDLTGSKAIVMHPLPRVNEITPGVDQLPNARYFEQVGYGVVMRMALLGLSLGAKL